MKSNSVKAIVETHPFFRGMQPGHLELIASDAKEMTFKPEQILFREGDPANQFFLLQSGRVALEAHGPGNVNVLVQNIGPGDVLGWSWLFPPFVWHLQARALEPTVAVVLSGGHLLTTAERDRDFGYGLMKRVAQVVIQRLQAVRKQLVERQTASSQGRKG